jgi:hypothetical protein
MNGLEKWRKLYNEDLYNFYTACSMHEAEEKCIKKL